MKVFTRIASKFVKNSENINDKQVRADYGKVASIAGILLNVLLFAGKLTIGLISNSVSITSDAVNNISDASSNVVSLFGFKLSKRPPDSEHPYGHGRYEYLSALMVAVLIMIIGVELFKSSVNKILNPEKVEFSIAMVCVLVLSMVIKLLMMLFNSEIGSYIKSSTLKATAADSRNDIISTGAVLAAAVISHIFNVELDGYMGVAVAVFILISGFGMIRDTIDPLLGSAPDPEMVEHIQKKIYSYDGVLGTHDLIVHDYGPGRQFASVHIEVAAEDDVLKTHDILDNIERDFLEHDNLHLVAHLDPISTSDSKVGELRIEINKIVKDINSQITIHDLRIVEGVTHTNAIFDCVVPHSVKLSEKEVKEQISEKVKAKHPTYNCVITIDREFAAVPKN